MKWKYFYREKKRERNPGRVGKAWKGKEKKSFRLKDGENV